MSSFAIAGIQMAVSPIIDNSTMMEHRLATLMAIYPWVQMVVYSELAIHGPLTTFAQPMPGPIEEHLCRMAKKFGVWLIPGSMYEKDGEKIYNTSPIINPDGEVIGRYRKMFPFFPYEEGVTPGDEFFVWDIEGIGRFGISICYDMWFPETTRTLASMGAEVIIHPSMTPTIDRDVELSIARTNAVINQCYMFDINGVGGGGNGKSIICGPEGTVLYQAGTSEEMIPIEIDLNRVRVSRERGLLRLGQVLKSFRDTKVHFSIYEKDLKLDYLETLGPLEKPERPQTPSASKIVSANGKQTDSHNTREVKAKKKHEE